MRIKLQLSQLALTRLLVLTLLACLPDQLHAVPQTWGWILPQEISDANTTVSFEVDSTWHLIKGRTAGLTGRVWLSNPQDKLSVKAKIDLPVARFDTNGEMRDERMRDVMDSEHSPNVTVFLETLQPQCDYATFKNSGSCAVILSTRLEIRGHRRPLQISAELVAGQNQIVLRGDARFSWVDFGVEDPSILVARLAPEVLVNYSVKIPTATNG